MGRLIWAVVIVSFVYAGNARAEAEVDLSIGYSHLSLDGSERFKERDGGRLEPRISFAPIDRTPQLRLGFGLGISGYSHELDDNTVITIDNGSEVHTFTADQWESLSLLEPELQISWRQMLDERGKWFVEPGVGIGAVVANYWVADNFWWSNDEQANEWDAAFAVRPFVRAGYRGERWVFGLEASYLFGGSIDLTDQVHGDVRELYAGGFFGFRW